MDTGAVAPPHVSVVVVEGLSIDDLRVLAPRAAVGLLVPGAGASTSRSYAAASLARGLDLNAAVRLPRLGRTLVRVTHSAFVPVTQNTIVLSLPTNTRLAPNDRRYAIAVDMPGYSGLLTSPTTRIPGLVSIADVAPTALGRLRGSLGHVPSADPVGQLAQLDARIHSNNRLKLPILLIVAGAMLLLALVRPGSAVPALLAALLSSLGAGAAGVANEPLLIAVVSTVTVVGGIALQHLCRDDRRLLTAIVLVLLLHVVLLVTKPEWVAISPLGPTQISRFWGIGNQLETLLLAPVVLGASLASRRYGLIGFGAFSIFVLVLITDNRLGSDGGGAIVFGIALAFVGTRSHRLGLRGFGILLGVAAAVVLMVILINLRAPGPDHLRSAFSGGLSGLALVLANRIPLAYLPAVREWPLFGTLASVLVLVLALALRTSDRHTRRLVIAAGAALVASLLANDSAVYELAGGVGVIGALARFEIPFATEVAGARSRSQLVRRPLLATTEERGEE
jgi:hypothetical protein